MYALACIYEFICKLKLATILQERKCFTPMWKENVPHLRGKCRKFLLATTFARGISIDIGIIRALWTVLNRVCHVAACTADRTRVSPTKEKYHFLYNEHETFDIKKNKEEITNSEYFVKLSAWGKL